MESEQANCRQRHGHHHKGQGPSSYWIVDPDTVFDILEIQPGERVLDLGCGAGDYAVRAAGFTGENGIVYAVDHWLPTIDSLKDAAQSMGLTNLEAVKASITQTLPFNDNDFHLCMIFTVLHIFNLKNQGEKIYKEIRRVLKPGGRLAVIECKKEDMPFGPPLHMRLSPEEIEGSLKGCGFEISGYADLGHLYLSLFTLSR